MKWKFRRNAVYDRVLTRERERLSREIEEFFLSFFSFFLEHGIHRRAILQCDGGSSAALRGHLAGLRIVAMVEAGARATAVRGHCATQHLLPHSRLRLPCVGFQRPLHSQPSHPCCGFPLQSRPSLLSPASAMSILSLSLSLSLSLIVSFAVLIRSCC